MASPPAPMTSKTQYGMTDGRKRKVGDDMRVQKNEKWNPKEFGDCIKSGFEGFLLKCGLDKDKQHKMKTDMKHFGDKMMYSGNTAILGIDRSNMKHSYNLGKALGEGGFGTVYEVTRKKPSKKHPEGTKFACKEQSKDRIVAEGMQKSVMNEYLIMKQLAGHENIIGLENAIEGRYHVYFILDHCKGGDVLQSIIQQMDKGLYTEKAAASIMKAMLTAVKVCHDNGVIHRDIKPENFLWQIKDDGERVLKLTDFGLSQIFTDKDETFTSGCGTPNYMPPEMWQRKPYGRNVDVWSLGVSLALMLTGEFPFDGESEEDLASKIVYYKLKWNEVPFNMLTQKRPDYPQEGVVELLQHMLEKDGTKRWSVEQCLAHPWFETAPSISLDSQIGTGIKKLLNFSQLHKAMMRLMVVMCGQEQIASMRSTFSDISMTGKETMCKKCGEQFAGRFCPEDGTPAPPSSITLKQLKLWLSSKPFGEHLNATEVEALFDLMDENHDGTLSLDEYVIMAMGLRSTKIKFNVEQFFNKIDADGDGFINPAEAKHVFESAGLSGEYFWEKADTDGDGRVSLDEFDAFVTKYLPEISSAEGKI